MAIVLGAAMPEDERLAGPIEARVLRIIDGDTIVVRARIWLRQEVETNVRVAGLDTPEKNGKCEGERVLAAQARALVESKLSDGRAVLSDIAFEKYGGRVVARVTASDGEDLAATLIGARLGRPYDGRAKAGWCG